MDLFLQLIYPKYCLLCFQKGKYICNECLKKMSLYDGPICPICKGLLRSKKYFIHKICKRHSSLDGLFPFVKYDERAKRIIAESKYKFGKEILFEIAEMLKNIYSNLPVKIDYLVPVPLSKEKIFKRGFNQSEVIANKINFKYKNILIKKHSTKSQAGSKRNERIKNIKNTFCFNNKFNLKDKNIILIDDVCTTGSTLLECAKVLKEEGAKRVYAIVWAKDEYGF